MGSDFDILINYKGRIAQNDNKQGMVMALVATQWLVFGYRPLLKGSARMGIGTAYVSTTCSAFRRA